jgi:hypothetical protein
MIAGLRINIRHRTLLALASCNRPAACGGGSDGTPTTHGGMVPQLLADATASTFAGR